MNQLKKCVGVISAMPIEMISYEQVLGDKITKQFKEQPFNIFKSKSSDIITAISRIGQVNAALCTTLMIEQFDPDIILYFGVAGSLINSLFIGDVVVGKKVFSAEYLNSHLNNIKCIYGTFPSFKYDGDADLLSIAKSLSNKSTLNVKEGTIVSSDYFPLPGYLPNDSEEFQLDICDMESAGFQQVCDLLKKPGLVIRGISNIVKPNTKIKIKKNDIEVAAKNAARFAFEITNYLTTFN
jgi:adenosylhomocysteine nucleosidase